MTKQSHSAPYLLRRKYTNLAHTKCVELLKNAIQNSTNNFQNSQNLYAFLDEIHFSIDENDKPYVCFSLITEDLLNFDSQDLYELDHPYFLSYIATENINQFIIDYEEIYLEANNKNRWFTVSFDKDIETLYSFNGYSIFSASPIKIEDNNLKIIDCSISQPILDLINATYEVTPLNDDKVITKEIDNIFSAATFSSFRVYKVGHGNLIKVNGRKDKKRFSFFYDIGCHFGRDISLITGTYRNSKLAIANSKVDAVILSHWDTDHIMGIVNSNKDIFNKPWIAPDVADNGLNAKRLACYLEHRKKLILINKNDEARVLYSNDDINVVMGRNKVTDKISKSNCSGIALILKSKNFVSRMYGDVPYKALVNTLGNLMNLSVIPPLTDVCDDYLVIPHHGREMSTTNLPKQYGSGDVEAIYCNNVDVYTTHIITLMTSPKYIIRKSEDCKTYFEFKLTSNSVITR